MNWYRNIAEQGDICLSTRVRLARNITQYPFPARLSAEQKKEVGEVVKEILKNEELKFIDMASLSPAETVSLAEKHLISPEFACDTKGRSLMLSEDEDVSIMICEEDHIRIQTILPGLSLDEAFKQAEKYDKILGSNLSYAFHDQLGYLTQCPTNIGTALRASVMLHLPALSQKGAIHRLSTTVAKLGLTLRGSYGEGSEVSGDIYQLSNQVTLGISEEAAIKNLNSIAMQIITQEKQTRAALVKDDDYLDRISRAYGILRSAHKLTTNELIKLISFVRVGVSEGILSIPAEKLKELTVTLQPATLNTAAGKTLSQSERDVLRAQKVKEELM
ncbi:MAG: protein arginine kinase [Clostridia bacterium]|nr:protein arginine kinase [Clostridia bacterium]